MDLLCGGQGVFGIALGATMREITTTLGAFPSEPPPVAQFDIEASLGALTMATVDLVTSAAAAAIRVFPSGDPPPGHSPVSSFGPDACRALGWVTSNPTHRDPVRRGDRALRRTACSPSTCDTTRMARR